MVKTWRLLDLLLLEQGRSPNPINQKANRFTELSNSWFRSRDFRVTSHAVHRQYEPCTLPLRQVAVWSNFGFGTYPRYSPISAMSRHT